MVSRHYSSVSWLTFQILGTLGMQHDLAHDLWPPELLPGAEAQTFGVRCARKWRRCHPTAPGREPGEQQTSAE